MARKQKKTGSMIASAAAPCFERPCMPPLCARILRAIPGALSVPAAAATAIAAAVPPAGSARPPAALPGGWPFIANHAIHQNPAHRITKTRIPTSEFGGLFVSRAHINIACTARAKCTYMYMYMHSNCTYMYTLGYHMYVYMQCMHVQVTYDTK